MNNVMSHVAEHLNGFIRDKCSNQTKLECFVFKRKLSFENIYILYKNVNDKESTHLQSADSSLPRQFASVHKYSQLAKSTAGKHSFASVYESV